jgi:hypothetical protein
MNPEDENLWRLAVILFEQHGAGAVAAAEERAKECLRDDEIEAHGVWLAVANCCRTLLKEKPAADEQVH